MMLWFFICFFFSSRRRHTRCALVTGVQTCALPISSPDAELGPGVRIDAVEEFGRIRPLHVDLAEGRIVEDADAPARRQDLAVDRLAHRLALARVVPGALPLADILEDRKSTRLNSSH